jgi:hypothetical protein
MHTNHDLVAWLESVSNSRSEMIFVSKELIDEINQHVKRAQIKITPSEAIYGFAGWLSVRADHLMIGANYNCIKLAELVDLFCRENDLEPPREQHFPLNIKHPEENVVSREEVDCASATTTSWETAYKDLAAFCVSQGIGIETPNHSNPRPWIGVDLDGTLAHYDDWKGEEHIGEPIPEMVERVKDWIKRGVRVKIFTARVSPVGIDNKLRDVRKIRERIEKWCLEHIGHVLEITNVKDYRMLELWDDRAKEVVSNTGVTRKDNFENELKQVAEEVEQLRVQLAACGAVALGYAGEPVLLGDYGYSDSYRHVLDLRLKADRMRNALQAMVDNPHWTDHIARAAAALGMAAERAPNKQAKSREAVVTTHAGAKVAH